jgi:lipoic acid synthetase
MKNAIDRKRAPKPPWLRRRLPSGPEHERVSELIRRGRLHTVCQEAKCPNQFECFSARTATFLILGSTCTRNCRFCNIEPGPLNPPDPDEPARVAAAAARMGLRYVVVTSVTRDDLEDGGAGIFEATIGEIRKAIPDALVEVLIPDFLGSRDALETVVRARPNVLNHNVETVPRLYPSARPEADYRRSLALLGAAAEMDPDMAVKSGIMLGLGETAGEIRQVLEAIHATGCGIVTIGQYLQPTERHLAVERFVPPEEFDRWRSEALEMGFDEAASGPFVRSSYHARELYGRTGRQHPNRFSIEPKNDI